MTDSQPQPGQRMFQLISGFWVAHAIHAATQLGLPGHLAEGPLTPQELAELTGTHPQSLYRLLRALAGYGVFHEDERGAFALTDLGHTLRPDVAGSLAPYAQMHLSDAHRSAWGELVHSVRTGEPAFDKAVGQPVWEFFAQNAEMAAHLNRAMHGLTELTVKAVLETYDFTPYRHLVDVGGGEGGLLTGLLAALPQATGVVFDLPRVVPGTGERIAAAGLADRCEAVGGDFFAEVPGGGDLYLLKWVLHDWSDAESVEILRNCRSAMGPEGRLLIIDTVVPTGNEPAPGKLIDLTMMVLSTGQERTAAQFEAVLREAGFELTRILPMHGSPSSVVEALPLPS
ncbi:methyltransferase [Kitasatospora nipponensis]|uniref:Methyltransferase n=1 Tax=Kitasatospora nipponensis TaxID=258049 RepID=A0ABN1VWZ9_9ACTN